MEPNKFIQTKHFLFWASCWLKSGYQFQHESPHSSVSSTPVSLCITNCICELTPSSCAFYSSVFWGKRGLEALPSTTWKSIGNQALEVCSLLIEVPLHPDTAQCVHMPCNMSPLSGPSIPLIGSFSSPINSVSAGCVSQVGQVPLYWSVSESVHLSICLHGRGAIMFALPHKRGLCDITLHPLCCAGYHFSRW